MKIIVDSSLLAEALEDANKAISSKAMMPVLAGFLIQTTNEGLVVTGADDRVRIQSYIMSEHVQIIRQGAVVLPKVFLEIIKKFSGEIQIDVGGNFETLTVCKNKEVEISGLNPNEFPSTPDINKDESIMIPGRDLKDWIKKTAFAVSADDKTPILTGINMIIEDSKIKMLATNRHRLARFTKEIDASFIGNTVVEGRGLTDLEKIVLDRDEVQFGFSKSTSGEVIFVFARTDRFTFYSRVLEGPFPDAEKLIVGAKAITTVKVNKKEFSESIDLIYTLAKEEKANTVKLAFTSKEVVMKGKGKGMGKVSEIITPLEFLGEDFSISLNAKYVIEALKVIDSNIVTITNTGKMSPLLLNGNESEGSMYVVLPYRTEV